MSADLSRDGLLTLVANYQRVFFDGTEPVEDSRGLTGQHQAWMLAKVFKEVTEGTMVLEKANRWVGWVQCWLVMTGLATLGDVKDSVRRFKD